MHSDAIDVFERMCAQPKPRREVLRQLLKSVQVANGLATESWAVTRFDTGFRLNVGPVEAFACIGGEVRLLLACAPTDVQIESVQPNRYDSLPQPQSVFVGTPEAFSKICTGLQQHHEAYLALAALKRDGRPYRCRYSRYHAPALIDAARQAVNDPPEQPHVVDQARPDISFYPTEPRQAHAKGNPYNGFSWAQRLAKFEEMKRRLHLGALATPAGPCRLCGDPGDAAGSVDFEYHDEDYSKEYSWAEPAAYVLCHNCHVHRLHMRSRIRLHGRPFWRTCGVEVMRAICSAQM